MPNIDINARKRVGYDENDGKPFFIISMTFTNTEEVRYAIAKYVISRGCKLHVKANKPHRIRATCVTEPGSPFVLLVSKDGHNPGLVDLL